MYICLFDRVDRLGSNIANYIAQILYAYNNKYIIKFNKEKENYNGYNSIFVKTLFNYIEYYNEKISKNRMNECECEYKFILPDDLINTITNSLKNIKTDFFTFFLNNIYNDIKPFFTNLSTVLYNINFDIDKTILVHLRLDDTAHYPDYDGMICSNYYKNNIANDKVCVLDFYGELNTQIPLSKKKLDNIINKAKQEFKDYKVILVTSPISDTTYLNYDYEVIKSDDENLDLYLLTMCKVTILSRSNFALSSLFYNHDKIKTYIPLWGHSACYGLDTIYDKTDRSKIEYFA